MTTISNPETTPHLAAEQTLDKIYHAIPGWVHYSLKDHPLPEKVQHAISVLTENWHKEIFKHCDTRSDLTGFSSFLCKKLGLEFGEAYWQWLQTDECKEIRNKRLSS